MPEPDYPPFMNSYNTVPKILDKIKDAKTPEKFSQDFLSTVLGFSGGSPKPFIPLAKRIGLLSSDGTPTDLYKQFRNPSQSEQAMAQAIRIGYPQLYKRNEYAHALDKKNLEGLVMEATGLDKKSNTLAAIVNTFTLLKSYANFELEQINDEGASDDTNEAGTSQIPFQAADPKKVIQKDILADNLKFSYNIYLNLPETTDQAVFNAIFKSLRENLLK